MRRRRDTSDENPSAAPEDRRLALACVGSPENAFADAGLLLALDGLSQVVFNRAERGDKVQVGGTAPGLRIDIPLPFVSAHHAELNLRAGSAEAGYPLQDCKSRNGTMLEGHPVVGEARIKPGDIFEVGRSFWALVTLGANDDERAIRRIAPQGAANGQMRRLLSSLGRVADASLPLLFTGETGVGKDWLAQAVHEASGADGEFVQANVMTTSVEQLLFGSGNDGGPLTQSRGGTLYLEDVGELDLSVQTKLLSALLSHAPAAWAARAPRDVRVIAASTRDLRDMVSRQEFRPDLLAQLAGFDGSIPPLRERREDLGLLVRALARRSDGSSVRVCSGVFRSMLAHDWPFNLRELRHALTAAVAMAADNPDGVTSAIWRAVCGITEGGSQDPARIQAVRQALVQHLVAHNGDTTLVAESMHCELGDVERWLGRLSIRPDHYGRAG